MPQSAFAHEEPEAPKDDFLVEWKEYAESDIFEELTAINQFQLKVQFPHFRVWTDADDMSTLGDILYDETYNLLDRSELYGFEHLRRGNPTEGEDGVSVSYGDADNQFKVELAQHNELTLTRPGAEMERFYEWYRKILPEYHDLYEAVRRQLGRATPEVDGTSRTVVPSRAIYLFKYVLHNFRPSKSRRAVANSVLMTSLLRQVPDADGHLVELDETRLGNLGRVDLQVSRWIDGPGGTIREVYEVKAPSNRDYRTLWLEFAYIAETRADLEGKRSMPDFSVFLRRYDYPILEFLQKRALTGFLTDVTHDVAFDSESGDLP